MLDEFRWISSPCLAIYVSFMEMLIAYGAKCVLIARINGFYGTEIDLRDFSELNESST